MHLFLHLFTFLKKSFPLRVGSLENVRSPLRGQGAEEGAVSLPCEARAVGQGTLSGQVCNGAAVGGHVRCTGA